MTKIPLRWRDRESLAPCAVAARGETARVLAHRVLDVEDETLAQWRGVATDETLILLGEREVLPWADGALYLGRDALATSLLLPTTRAPQSALDLFERALKLQFPEAAPPLAVFEDGEVVSLANAHPISRDVMMRWLKTVGQPQGLSLHENVS